MMVFEVYTTPVHGIPDNFIAEEIGFILEIRYEQLGATPKDDR